MAATTTSILSAQERAIVEGKRVLHGTAADRVLRMFEAIRSVPALEVKTYPPIKVGTPAPYTPPQD